MRPLSLAVLAALIGACGDDGGAMNDAGGGDGPADAMVDADPNVRGTVTVHLVDKNDRPLPGMHVVFIDTDTTVTEVVTDANGVASASVYPNASVTAIRERTGGGAYSMTTLLALNPGDDITLISAASGAVSGEDPFTLRQVPLPSADIATAVKSGANSIVTTLAPHGLAVGDSVTIEGVQPVGYNGVHTVTAVGSATTFTIAYDNNTAGSGGIAFENLPFTVSFPAFAGATSYEVHTPCGTVDVGTQLSPVVRLREGCASSPMDILVYAKSSSTTELAYAFQPAVAFTPGGSVSITSAWQTVSTVTATYTNPTSRVTSIQLGRHTPYLRGTPPASATATADATTTFMLDTALPPAAWMRSTLRCPTDSGPDCISSAIGVAQQTYTHQVDGTATSYALDVGANLLPWVSAVWVPETATLDLEVTGTGTIDLFEANIRYGRGQTIYTWRIFGPEPHDIVFPTLPSTVPGDPTIRLCPSNPCTDTQSVYQVYLCESDAIASYRDAIKNPYATLATCESPSTVSTRPTGGTINRLSQWQ